MVGPLPLVKLGFLLVKQISKPVAKSIAAQAKQSGFFRDYVCIPIAQAFHFYEVKMKMKALNLGTGKVTKVPKLSETKAVEMGSELLSELIILSIASSLLVYEYNRSKEKEEDKENKLKADREMVKNKIFELELQVEKQNTHIRNLTKMAIHMEEETQKTSLRGVKRRLLGETLDVPKELTDTLADIPEQPREVKPMHLPCDEAVPVTATKEEVTPTKQIVPEKTKIQQIVEEHYSKTAETAAVAVKAAPEDSKVTAVVETEAGVVTKSLEFTLKK